MDYSPMRRSALTFNGVSMFTIDMNAWKEQKRRAAIKARIISFLTLWSALAVISMSAALLTPIHFA